MEEFFPVAFSGNYKIRMAVKKRPEEDLLLFLLKI